MIICVDYDGTIVDHQFPMIGEPNPGSFEWMRKWQEAGAQLILWTMRSDGREGDGAENDDVLSQAVQLCSDNGVEFWGINENPDQDAWTKSPKAYAHIYVDDAAFGCPLTRSLNTTRLMVDWAVVGPAVLEAIIQSNPKAA